MDDWMRAMLSGQGKEHGADAVPDLDLDEAYRVASQEARDFMRRLIELGRPLNDAGKSVEASALIFIGVWQAVAMAKNGVDALVEKYGAGTPVLKMWNLLQTVLLTKNEGEAIAAGEKWRKENGL